MTDSPKRRGRPRAYDPDAALRRALDTFWDAGYAATSLDDLGDAMGMNRPSLYGAFGDKRALYLKTLELYKGSITAGMRSALDDDRPLRECLDALYAGAIDLYLGGENGARGCFLIGTAATEAVNSPEVRELFIGALHTLDAEFERRFRRAQRDGEIAPEADPAALAGLAAAVLHTLALRSRGGEPRAALERIAAAGADMLLRVGGARSKKPRR